MDLMGLILNPRQAKTLRKGSRRNASATSKRAAERAVERATKRTKSNEEAVAIAIKEEIFASGGKIVFTEEEEYVFEDIK